MGLGDELNDIQNSAASSAPKGWTPGVEFDANGGEGRTAPRVATDTPLGHEEILAEFGLDPNAWEVVTLRRSKWQQSKRLENGDRDVLWLEAYKATFRALTPHDEKAIRQDFDALSSRIAGWKRPKPARLKAGLGPQVTFACALSDFQFGKGEGGGTPATLERVLSSLDGAVDQLDRLRRSGYAVREVALIGLGDLVEGCAGFYNMQEWQADLDGRQQVALVCDVVAKYIDTFVPLVDRVVVTGVGGNHGEQRKDGKAFTTFSDNTDLLVLDMMRRYQERDRLWSNVQVWIPEDPLSLCVELSGAKLGAVHGHQFGRGQGAVEKGRLWWQGQSLGNGPVAEADILWAGHLHHHVVNQMARGRTFMQAPSQDGGSYWYRSITGQDAPTGMMTMLVGSELGESKYDHLRIL